MPVSGTARLEIIGRMDGVDVGDDVVICGQFSRPRPRRNPGEFDMRNYLRSRGVRTVVWADTAKAVRVVGRDPRYWLDRLRSHIRQRCESQFKKSLSCDAAALAVALVLGKRTGITKEVRDTFVESGTMHLLAISGLHVGILALMFWAGARLLNLSPTGVALMLLVGVLTFAFVTDLRPSVVRATILVAIGAAAIPWHGRVLSSNSVALAATVVLLWHPCDLFDPGAQLSFLAVSALLWAGTQRPIATVRHIAQSPRGNPAPVERLRPRFSRLSVRLSQAYLMSAAVWIVTAPLIAVYFNIVSPVGLLINVLLIPVVMFSLWFAYALIVTGFLLPLATPVFAVGCDGLLRSLLLVVDEAARIRLGHLYVPCPPLWWLTGAYLLMAGAMLGGRNRFVCVSLWRSLGVWLVLGLALGLRTPARSELSCTFLSVGHGCAVLVETPDGRTLLYDAGMINSEERATRTVESALWHRGLSQIDAILISHPDTDHFNGVPGLLLDLAVGSIVSSRSFLDFDQSGVAYLCNMAARRDIPIKLAWAGDRLFPESRAHLELLHPPIGTTFETDNANSIVLLLEYSGRQILLCGDIEGDGMRALLAGPQRTIDVLMAPHHGSLSDNPEELVRWAKPRFVVASSGQPGTRESLQLRYGSAAQVFCTIDGAVTVSITSTGDLDISQLADVPKRVTAD